MGVLSDKTFRFCALGIALAALSPAVLCAASSEASDDSNDAREPIELVLIVSDSLPLKDISMATLRRLFTGGKVELDDGTMLIAINAAPRTPEREVFDLTVLDMDPDALGRFWIDQKIRGVAMPPKTIASRTLAAKVVDKLKGAITYVASGQAPPGTHVLSVDGKRPGEKGYPLKR
jgi:hypothetical protein